MNLHRFIYRSDSQKVQRVQGTAICYDFHQQMTPGLRFIPLKGIGAVGAVLAWKKQQALSKAARIFLGYCHTHKDDAATFLLHN